MRNQTLLFGDVVSERTLQVHDKLLLQNGDGIFLASEWEAFKIFKENSHCVLKFMKPKIFSHERALGNVCVIWTEKQHEYGLQLKNHLDMKPIEKLCNTEEVSVIYRCLPRRSVHERDLSSSLFFVKDGPTVVIKIVSNDVKDPLEIIRKPKRLQSITGHMDTPRDLGISYYSQAN